MEFDKNLTDGLIEIAALKDVLGYKDSRSVCSWCSEKSIQVVSLGKKNYISQFSWNNYLKSILQHSNPSQTKLADHSGRLAGNNSIDRKNGSSFTSQVKANQSDSTLSDIATKYNSLVNG